VSWEERGGVDRGCREGCLLGVSNPCLIHIVKRRFQTSSTRWPPIYAMDSEKVISMPECADCGDAQKALHCIIVVK
jgi:hypothetical protein